MKLTRISLGSIGNYDGAMKFVAYTELVIFVRVLLGAVTYVVLSLFLLSFAFPLVQANSLFLLLAFSVSKTLSCSSLHPSPLASFSSSFADFSFVLRSLFVVLPSSSLTSFGCDTTTLPSLEELWIT